MKQERGLIMALHSALIALVIYTAMRFMNVDPLVAEDRSLVIFAILLFYMIVFGHNMPTSINKNIAIF